MVALLRIGVNLRQVIFIAIWYVVIFDRHLLGLFNVSKGSSESFGTLLFFLLLHKKLQVVNLAINAGRELRL